MLNVNIYNIRRNKLIETMRKNSICILYSGQEYIRNGDIHYSYRQDSDFLYLTGISSPYCIFVLYKWWENNDTLCLIFSEPMNEKELLWGTNRMDPYTITQISWIQDIYPQEKFQEIIQELIKKDTILYRKDVPFIPNILFEKQEQLGIWENIHLLRQIKTLDEIETIKAAIQITHNAYEFLKNTLRPGMFEYEIEAMIAYIFRRNHSTEAFPSIVASNKNSCTLHYTKHSRKISCNDWLLIDFGAEINGYAADISRSFLIGKSNKRYMQVFESVQKIKEYAENILHPWISIADWNKEVKDMAYTICIELWLKMTGYTPLTNPYFPHSIGHYLGLDTHDVGDRKSALLENMILTCEPWIYIPEEWIGIRIEDDIRITHNGIENLSNCIPIESLFY